MDSSKANYVLKVFDRKLGLRKILPRLVKKGQLFWTFLTDDTVNEKQLFDPRPFSRKTVKGNFFLICLERSQFPSGIFLILLILGCDLAKLSRLIAANLQWKKR